MTVPYHLADIPKPQNAFVGHRRSNLNQPFDHVWLQRCQDDGNYIHPLGNFSSSEFIDQDVNIEPLEPLRLEKTPFTFVEDVKQLKLLAETLKSVDEFAVDLEDNSYRSFQGITCLMQISTRDEDFIVDTLKLRIYVGLFLRDVFKDPLKKKVMHGADNDILWLQREFGIYVCNLFDTQQASVVLNPENNNKEVIDKKNSLEYILHDICGVTADKTCQKSDWRLRPLPEAMIRYAREDTHYLLYIHDQMRLRLLSSPRGRDGLLQVYKKSYDICMKLYETKLFTDTSYLYIKGLRDADFDSQQLSIAAALYEWRDFVARADDESTGYILANKALLKIAKHKPLTLSALRELVKPSRAHAAFDYEILFELIQESLQNASAFESTSQLLRTQRQEAQKTAKDQTTSSPQRRTGKGPNKMTIIWREAQKMAEDRTILKREISRYLTLKREIVECSRCKHLLICSRCLQIPGATDEDTSEEECVIYFRTVGVIAGCLLVLVLYLLLLFNFF